MRERHRFFGLTRIALTAQDTSKAAHLRLMENGVQKAVRPATLMRLCEMLKCDLPHCELIECNSSDSESA